MVCHIVMMGQGVFILNIPLINNWDHLWVKTFTTMQLHINAQKLKTTLKTLRQTY
jgi:hypothetical protein